MVSQDSGGQTPLPDDLVELLSATRDAEHELYAVLSPDVRDEPARIGDWSAKDVLAHLGAWRSIEARRLVSEGTPGEAAPDDGDPGPDDPVDESNARLHARSADKPWDEVAAAADESIDALSAAIRATPAETLRSSGRMVAGIGGNGANHALGHLSDVAALAGANKRFRVLAARIEAILLRGRIPDEPTGTMIYNIACHDALTGQLDDARRRLRNAFRLRPDLVDWAEQDSDVAALKGELRELAATPAG
jgi:hypothetical protein